DLVADVLEIDFRLRDLALRIVQLRLDLADQRGRALQLEFDRDRVADAPPDLVRRGAGVAADVAAEEEIAGSDDRRRADHRPFHELQHLWCDLRSRLPTRPTIDLRDCTARRPAEDSGRIPKA